MNTKLIKQLKCDLEAGRNNLIKEKATLLETAKSFNTGTALTPELIAYLKVEYHNVTALEKSLVELSDLITFLEQN